MVNMVNCMLHVFYHSFLKPGKNPKEIWINYKLFNIMNQKKKKDLLILKVELQWGSERQKDPPIYSPNGCNELARAIPGAWNSIWGLHVHAGDQALGSSSAAFLGALAGSMTTSRAVRIQTSGHMGYWHCTWWLNPQCHNAVPNNILSLSTY